MITMDLETELYQLERQMMRLVKHRAEVIDRANQLIDEANAEFDQVAVTLGHQINELRERLHREERPIEKTRRERKIDLDGLEDDEQEHFKELLAKRRKK